MMLMRQNEYLRSKGLTIFSSNRHYIKYYPFPTQQILDFSKLKQEGHDGPEIAHLSLLTKHAPSSFPVT